MIETTILFFIGFVLSIVSLVVGSMTPVYLTLMQFFFPHLTLGNIIGADKTNGVFRNLGAIPSFWKEIDWKFVMTNIPPFLIGVILGVSIVAEVSTFWVFPFLIIGFIIAEFAEKFAKYFSAKKILILEFLLGIYGGLIVAAIKVILLSVFRLKYPDDTKIMYLKIQIQTMMIFMVITGTIVHYLHGNLLWEIILPLGAGNIIGGFIGGKILMKTGKLSGKIQKNIMRLSFLFGIVASGWMIWMQ